MEPNVNANPEPEKESDLPAEPLEAAAETQPEVQPEVVVQEDEAQGEEVQNVPEMAFSWEASEFVHHHKSPMWYLVVGAIAVLLTAICIYRQYWVEIGMFPMMAAAVMVYGHKAPRTLSYELSVDGIHIDGRLYPFAAFRSFSVSKEPEWHSIDLEPVKRFSPRIVMLYDPEDYDPIIGHLELHLPREDREPDLIEKITRAVRF